MKIKNISLILLVAFLYGCITPPTYPDEPVLEFVSVSRNQVNIQDTFLLKFSFTDGDGDLGMEVDISDSLKCGSVLLDATDFQIFLIDNRTNCYQSYEMPFIPPKGSSNAISGEVSVVAPLTCCFKPEMNNPCLAQTGVGLDTLIYSIQIRDRSNNYSNVIQTSPILIDCSKAPG